jgi:hypothetical protein
MSKLHISANLSLPVESVTQTFAILGIRGSGKTNAYLQRLVSRRLVETFGRGEVKASDNLFD